MPRKPKRRPFVPRPALTAAQVLAWCDDFHERKGRWPNTASGRVPANLNEKWLNIDLALRRGFRGLPGGDSLARLLQRERGVRNVQALPPLTEAMICRWAEGHHAGAGEWPTENSGPVGGAPGETWMNVNQALRVGDRGLPGGDTLAKLLARRLRVRNRAGLPTLTEAKVRRWAADHERRTGRPPNVWSGEVLAAPGETWRRLDDALRKGLRGLPGGSSVARLLTEGRGAATVRSRG